MILSLATACGSASPKAEPVVLSPGRGVPTTEHAVWVVGFAQQSKLGAIVTAGELVVTCRDLPAWPADLVGSPVVVAGTLSTVHHPPLPIGPDGGRSAGAEGDELVLAPGTAPPQSDDGLIAAERAVFDAISHRDGKALAALIAPDFVLHVGGQPDLDRQAFLAAAAAIEGEILSVDGTGLVAHRAGDTGVVRGTQVARVRLNGEVVDDRNRFLDVFVQRGGRWIVSVALSPRL